MIILVKYVNERESRITWGYYLQILTTVTLKLLRSMKSKLNRHDYDENVPHLEINEVVLVHCNTVNNDYYKDSAVLYTFATNKSFG